MKKAKRVVWHLTYVVTIATSVIVAMLIQGSSLGTSVEQRTYDVRFRLRGPLPPSTEAPITILALDEETLDNIPDPLMLWHRHFAQLIESLVEARAGAIGLDFIFEDIQAFDPDGQRALTRSLLLAGQESVPIVLGYRVSGTGVHQPPAPLAFAASAVGHSFAYVNLTGDNDDFIRDRN